ncbi:hypothetical protein MKW98_031996 [Papaver atlanticum]|uniref:Uncharacterized protein n=1 Tax=Papaver atlanticum TaxID=357466 RepID=A0AAD4SFL1_9MAGN|nr:hypothetical protein MKW98_031996 [Papaver atlanticum]
MSSRDFKSIASTETLEMENGLSVVPRVKLLLTIYRSDHSVKPIDEWQLKLSLLDHLKKGSFSPPLTIPEDDLEIHCFKDIKKRKREAPVASGTLYVRDLGFFHHKEKKKEEGDAADDDEEWKKVLEKKFIEWRNSFVKKLDGVELNLQGVKFKANAVLPISDDFDRMKKSWEGFYAFDSRGVFCEDSKATTRYTDTKRVFGKIRNLNAAGDFDLVRNGKSIFSGLQCKIVVQFEKYDDFCNAMKVLCGRSIQKQGSHLEGEYEVTWVKGEFFHNSLQTNGPLQDTVEQYNNKRPSIHSRLTQNDSEGLHPKQYKVISFVPLAVGLLLAYHVVMLVEGGRAIANKLSEEEDLELERQLNLLNKQLNETMH